MPDPRRQVSLFLAAVQVLTRVPVGRIDGWQPDHATRAARYFSLVGALVGVACAGALLLTARLWGGAVPALIAVASGVALTGALHEDGLADAADGLGGGGTPERRLAIMKDSRIGTFGALALGLALAARVLALAALPLWDAAWALIASNAAARAAAVTVMGALPYAGDPARAKLEPAAVGVTRGELLIAIGWAAIAAAPAFAAAPLRTILSLAVAGGAAWLVTSRVSTLIGGWVGDTLGAVEQTVEVAFLLAFAAWR